jgi:hypothetical protein
MSKQPDIVLLGYGVDDTLQITVESQRLLASTGKAYTLGLPPNLARLLKSMRVETDDLSGHLTPGRPYGEAYLDVAEILLRRAAEERPVLFLTYGNPMFLNSLSRFLFLQAGQRGLRLQVKPGISQLDLIISDLGLDVGAFGLQLFDARRLVAKRQQVDPRVPLLVLQLAGLAAETVPAATERPPDAAFGPLREYLGQAYPGDHLVTLLNLPAGNGGGTRTTVPMARFAELLPSIEATSHLFIDAIRPRRRGDTTSASASVPAARPRPDQAI